jgi:hypothetical protein
MMPMLGRSNQQHMPKFAFGSGQPELLKRRRLLFNKSYMCLVAWWWKRKITVTAVRVPTGWTKASSRIWKTYASNLSAS